MRHRQRGGGESPRPWKAAMAPAPKFRHAEESPMPSPQKQFSRKQAPLENSLLDKLIGPGTTLVHGRGVATECLEGSARAGCRPLGGQRWSVPALPLRPGMNEAAWPHPAEAVILWLFEIVSVLSVGGIPLPIYPHLYALGYPPRYALTWHPERCVPEFRLHKHVFHPHYSGAEKDSGEGCHAQGIMMSRAT